MRGDDDLQEGMFSYISPEKRVPTDHPLRPIRKMVDEILKEMSPKFAKLYSDVGRPSIAPERLLRSLLLQVFYSVRSERMLIEQLQYNMLFRWFVGMEMDEAVWNHAAYSKNRERLLNEEIAESFFQRVLERAKPYMSDEHFTVDGTLIEAWASQKSFRRKDGKGEPPGPGGEVDFHNAVVGRHGVSAFRFGDPHRTFRSAFEGCTSEPETRGNSSGCTYLIA
jgi:transposase